MILARFCAISRDHEKAKPTRAARGAIDTYNFSTIVVIPIPPPTHNVTKP